MREVVASIQDEREKSPKFVLIFNISYGFCFSGSFIVREANQNQKKDGLRITAPTVPQVR